MAHERSMSDGCNLRIRPHGGCDGRSLLLGDALAGTVHPGNCQECDQLAFDVSHGDLPSGGEQ